MALNNPGTQIYLRDAKQKLNPQLLYAYGIVLGYSSLGTRGQRYTLRGSEQLADFGNGEGIELAAEILAKAGAPVDFVPIEGTGQTPDDPDKTPASGAVAKVVYGAIKLPGADANGDLLFQALANGATLTVQTGMSLTATTNGSAVVLTVPAATAASDVVTWWNGVSPAAVAAAAVFAIYQQGTGASNAGTTLALTNSNLGNLTFSAPDEGYEVRIVVSGNNTALSASYGGTGNKQLTINLATDADGTPTSTAAAVKTTADAALPVPAAGRINITSGGTGLAGRLPSFYALVYGSSSALSVSGTSPDDLYIGVRFLKAGTVGGTGIAYEWTADGWITKSSPQQLPVSGVVSTLADSSLNTGLTLTFTGTFEVGDEWNFFAPKPVVAFSDIQDAIEALLLTSGLKRGFITSPTAMSKTQIQIIDGLLQAAYNRVWLRFYAAMRDIEEGETVAEYEAALGADLLGFYSYKGISRATAGGISHVSTYTGRKYARLFIFSYVPRRCQLALHQDPMQKDLGPLPSIRFVKNAAGVVTDAGITYDAYPVGSLPSDRLICSRTWDEEGEGRFYVNNSPTLADPSTPHYARVPYVDVMFELGRALQERGNNAAIGKTFRTISRQESELVPAGALDSEDAHALQTELNEAANFVLYSIKTDGNTSAGDLEADEVVVEVRRDYSYRDSDPKTIKYRARVRLRGIVEYIEGEITPEF